MRIQTIDILEQADRFLDVTIYCIGPYYNASEYVSRRWEWNDESTKYLFPKDEVTAIVNSAFGCELYLKAMLNCGDLIREHDLKILFLKLDDVWKRVIIKLIGEPENMFNYFLEQASDAFEKWRYIYEREDEEKSFYFLFIKKFVFALKKVAYSKYYYEQKSIEKIDKEVLEVLVGDPSVDEEG